MWVNLTCFSRVHTSDNKMVRLEVELIRCSHKFDTVFIVVNDYGSWVAY